MGKEKIKILKKDLYHLYHNEKKSTIKIAKMYNCHCDTIRRRLLKLGIPVRGRITIPKKDLYQLYHKEDKSTLKIAQIYNCNFQTICNKLREFNIPRKSKSQAQMRYAKYDFSYNLEEKAYLIGFRIGDLKVYKTRPYAETVVVHGHTTKIAQATLIKDLFKKYGQVTITFCKDGTIDVNCYLNQTFHFLLPKADNVEPWILQNPDSFIAFMAGYIDAEGSFGVNQGRARFKLDSYDKKILQKVYSWCCDHHIRSKFFLVGKKGQMRLAGYPFNEDLWRLNVNDSNSLFRFLNILQPFVKHKKRIHDMRICMRNLQKRERRGTIKLV